MDPAGGSPYAIVGMLDTMQAIGPDIATIAMGTCSSTATVLLVNDPLWQLAGCLAPDATLPQRAADSAAVATTAPKHCRALLLRRGLS